MFDTDVLVVGTGPAGATCALALATYGIGVRVATRWNWLANSPRAHITNQRALEVLRDLGVEEQATAVATQWSSMGEMVFAPSLTGPEIARLRTWGTGENRLSDYLQGSPCPLLDIPQPYLEPVLVENAAARGAQVMFNTEYLSHRQDDTGVTSVLRDLLTGHEYTVRSRYLFGADGARSTIVDELGLPIEGTMGRAGTVYARFTADLARYVAHRPGILHRIMIPAFGEIGLNTLRAVRPWHEWIAGWGYDLDGPEPDLRPAVVLDRIRSMIGDPNVEVTITDVTRWQVNQAWATRYDEGRVFCGGDAVHRHPPSSGLGSNTSIQDAFNLAWKLAYVVKGWADPGLLDTYSPERVPIGKQVVARANQSRMDYGLLNEVIGSHDSGSAQARLRLLEDPGPDGVAAREALVAAVERKNEEFNAHGTELNQRYESTAVLVDPNAPQEQWSRDRGLYVQATTRPGAKIPHVWLIDETGHKRSTLDVVGKGSFTVVTGLAGHAWAAAVRKLALPFLRSVVVGEPQTRDSYHDWFRVREIAEAGVLLVRPDGYVAWRHVRPAQDDAEALMLLERALTAVLGQSAAQDS
ncbi:2,4-dichlorophenol 6-monooxygenase [Micromonospora craniellae]|uniref:2,4-dichlorophenol 6-monooxygenase n=2 Tax=Micromonospora craniellae TaxID=2294034 RepID=A0A372FYY1_9ACTN|nr:2,4-dichlorophenol 6-monooxygenase [Micromonospora craniellae]